MPDFRNGLKERPPPPRLMHICEKFSDHVQILHLLIWDEDCLKSICQGLTNCCPNLKQLRIEGEFARSIGVDLFPFGGEGILARKPNLTVFAFTCMICKPEIQFLKDLANFIQLVVNASPNLRGVTIPWGFYPDFANSKCLESLNISLDDVDPFEIEDVQNVSKLSEMLHQVDGQLVSLCFGTVQKTDLLGPLEYYHFKNSSPIGFNLLRRMPKLRKFCNRIVEMFRSADFLQNIEMMPFLETLVIGRDLKQLRGVDAILRGICNAKMILPSVRKLELIELYDPKLLDGVATAFPNLERLEMVQRIATGLWGQVDKVEMDIMLEACRDWSGLKHFKVTLWKYPEKMGEFLQGLLQGREFFQRLTTFEIKTRHYQRMKMTRSFTEDEMALFKQLLLVWIRWTGSRLPGWV
ncbi:uncharacterized protein LOC118437451 [Folsomia candida]|uniref:uncharacterized protein LOC118437451 n=1 Tax=Folsomia candida TaxID=158441 RepID=UPI001605295E|nr:uncharacterized protein LOC118437451 [Folsomia candida]